MQAAGIKPEEIKSALWNLMNKYYKESYLPDNQTLHTDWIWIVPKKVDSCLCMHLLIVSPSVHRYRNIYKNRRLVDLRT